MVVSLNFRLESHKEEEEETSPSTRDDSHVFPQRLSTVTEVNRGSIFALRRSTLDFCLGGQRRSKGNLKPDVETRESSLALPSGGALSSYTSILDDI